MKAVMIKFQGRKLNIADWARELGMSRQTLHHRLKAGWTLRNALTKPIDKRFDPTLKKGTLNG